MDLLEILFESSSLRNDLKEKVKLAIEDIICNIKLNDELCARVSDTTYDFIEELKRLGYERCVNERNDEMKNIGRLHLKIFRIKKQMTQREIAEEVGISYDLYAGIETGRYKGNRSFWRLLKLTYNLNDEEIIYLKQVF